MLVQRRLVAEGGSLYPIYMIDLSQTAGFTLNLDANKLVFGGDVLVSDQSKRDIEDEKNVLFGAKPGTVPLYFIHRDVRSQKDDEFWQKANLRYDVTLILPGKINHEFIKTYGHYHPIAENRVTYPEIYEVLYGEAHSLQQKVEGKTVLDLRVVKASAGEKIIIPPGYGHVTINPTSEPLVLANVLERNFTYDYTSFAEHGGAAFYETDVGWIQNPEYEGEKLVFAKTKKLPNFGISDQPLYTIVTTDPLKFRWLLHPAEYDFSNIFEKVNY